MIWPFENDTSKVIEKLARYSLKSEKRRNIMTIITIALAAFLMSMFGTTVFSTVHRQNTQAEDSYEAVYPQITEEAIELLGRQPEADRVGKGYMLGMEKNPAGYGVNLSYADEDCLYAGRAQLSLAEGTYPEGLNEIGAPKQFLEKYAPESRIGDSISLLFDGKTYTFEIVAILNVPDTNIDSYGFLVSEAFIKADHTYTPDGYYGYVHFKNADSYSEEELKLMAEEIRERLTLPSVSYNSMYFIGSSSIEPGNILPFAAIIFLIVIGSSIVIQSIFRISVNGRVQSYGQLRTIGATRKQIKKVVRRESLKLAIIGILTGIFTGSIAGTILAGNLFSSGFSAQIVLVDAVVVAVICAGMVSSAVRVPVKIASQTSPMEAIRHIPYINLNKKNEKRPHKITPYRLALMNMGRERKKMVSILLSLTLGGVLLLISASVFESYSPEQNARTDFLYGDFRIYLDDDSYQTTLEQMKDKNPLDERLYESILDIDGVKEIVPVRFSVGSFDFKADTISDGRGRCDILTPDGAVTGDSSFEKKYLVAGRMPVKWDEVLISETYYQSEDSNVEPGDSLILTMDESNRDIQVTVSGIMDDAAGQSNGMYVFDDARILVTEEMAKYMAPDIENFSYTWEIVTDPMKEQNVETQLEKLADVAPSGFQIYTFQDAVDYYEFQHNAIFGSMQGISVIIFLFGVVNLINTTLSNQNSRRREISMMRAAGMTQRQLCHMFTAEGLIYIGYSILAMLAAGLPAALAICNFLGTAMYGKPMDYRFPFIQIGGYLLILILLQMILSVWSVKDMNKRSLVEQLHAVE